VGDSSPLSITHLSVAGGIEVVLGACSVPRLAVVGPAPRSVVGSIEGDTELALRATGDGGVQTIHLRRDEQVYGFTVGQPNEGEAGDAQGVMSQQRARQFDKASATLRGLKRRIVPRGVDQHRIGGNSLGEPYPWGRSSTIAGT
jgi:hypothetical protein